MNLKVPLNKLKNLTDFMIGLHCLKSIVFCLTKRKAYIQRRKLGTKIANCSIISRQFSSSCGDLKLEVVFTKFFMQKITSLNCALHDFKVNIQIFSSKLYIRDRPRFFDQVGHQTNNASIGNKHFFTI